MGKKMSRNSFFIVLHFHFITLPPSPFSIIRVEKSFFGEKNKREKTFVFEFPKKKNSPERRRIKRAEKFILFHSLSRSLIFIHYANDVFGFGPEFRRPHALWSPLYVIS